MSDRLVRRWHALECARIIVVALSQLTREVGALAAHAELDACRRMADGNGSTLARLMADAVTRAERGERFPDGPAWRRAA